MATVTEQVVITLHFANGTEIILGSSSDTGKTRARSKMLDYIGADDRGGFARDSTRKKKVKGIRFEFDPPPTGATEVELFAADKLSDGYVSQGVFPVSSDGFVRCHLPNRRYYAFEIRDENSVGRWTLTAIEIFGAPTGDRKL